MCIVVITNLIHVVIIIIMGLKYTYVFITLIILLSSSGQLFAVDLLSSPYLYLLSPLSYLYCIL